MLNCINLELSSSHEMGKLTTYRRISGLACKQSFDVPGHRGEIRINKAGAIVEVKDYNVATRSRNPSHFYDRRCRIFEIK